MQQQGVKEGSLIDALQKKGQRKDERESDKIQHQGGAPFSQHELCSDAF